MLGKELSTKSAKYRSSYIFFSHRLEALVWCPCTRLVREHSARTARINGREAFAFFLECFSSQDLMLQRLAESLEALGAGRRFCVGLPLPLREIESSRVESSSLLLAFQHSGGGVKNFNVFGAQPQHAGLR